MKLEPSPTQTLPEPIHLTQINGQHYVQIDLIGESSVCINTRLERHENGEVIYATWQEAIEHLRDMGKTGITEAVAHIVQYYIDDINEAIISCDGDVIEREWTVSPFCTDTAYAMSGIRTVRPIGTHTSYPFRIAFRGTIA